MIDYFIKKGGSKAIRSRHLRRRPEQARRRHNEAVRMIEQEKVDMLLALLVAECVPRRPDRQLKKFMWITLHLLAVAENRNLK